MTTPEDASPEHKITKRLTPWRMIGRIALIIGGIGIGLVTLAVATVYLWPLRTASLRSVHPARYSYEQAMTRVQTLIADETAQGVTPDCRTKLLTHGAKTTKAVVLFHGVASCPRQMDALGQAFFDQGYNVLEARSPMHGLADTALHGKATAQQYVRMADEATNIAGALGESVGAAGLSGGGVLATWVTEYRPDVIERLLVLSPFYAPAQAQVPTWKRPLLNVLYGYGLLSDAFTAPEAGSLSYHALGQFGRIVANLTTDGTNVGHLVDVASVISPTDGAIDHALARSIPETLAKANGSSFHYFETPTSWQLGHDIVSGGTNSDIKGHGSDLWPVYIDLYEGKAR